MGEQRAGSCCAALFIMLRWEPGEENVLCGIKSRDALL